jgi:hypothetical protein
LLLLLWGELLGMMWLWLLSLELLLKLWWHLVHRRLWLSRLSLLDLLLRRLLSKLRRRHLK